MNCDSSCKAITTGSIPSLDSDTPLSPDFHSGCFAILRRLEAPAASRAFLANRTPLRLCVSARTPIPRTFTRRRKVAEESRLLSRHSDDGCDQVGKQQRAPDEFDIARMQPAPRQ